MQTWLLICSGSLVFVDEHVQIFKCGGNFIQNVNRSRNALQNVFVCIVVGQWIDGV